MKASKKYSIPFFGLKNGIHEFEYSIDATFFEELESSIVKSGNFNIRIELDKSDTILVLDFFITGDAEVTCDRCAENFILPIDSSERLYVKLSGKEDELGEVSQDVVFLKNNEHEIDISVFLYDYINLAVPYINIHPDLPDGSSGCNPDTIALLEKLRVKSDNDNAEDNNDPRWSALQNIRNN